MDDNPRRPVYVRFECPDVPDIYALIGNTETRRSWFDLHRVYLGAQFDACETANELYLDGVRQSLEQNLQRLLYHVVEVVAGDKTVKLVSTDYYDDCHEETQAFDGLEFKVEPQGAVRVEFEADLTFIEAISLDFSYVLLSRTCHVVVERDDQEYRLNARAHALVELGEIHSWKWHQRSHPGWVEFVTSAWDIELTDEELDELGRQLLPART